MSARTKTNAKSYRQTPFSAGRSHRLDSRPLMYKQRGVAVITAILVVALGTITMVSITASQQLAMQRERNEGLIQQARSLGYSGERFASAILYRDVQAELRNNSDSLEDDWAQPIPPVPIDAASITGCVVDMQGRFNLNNLIDANGDVAPDYVEQLKRLLRQINIEETKADSIVDWIDSDINFTGDGAEDDYYTGLEVGYRAANAPFVSVSELQLVKGFSSAIEEEAEDYALLLPHISVIPYSAGQTVVNVNTATTEVLASLSDDIALVASTYSRWDTGAYEDYPQCENIFDLDAEIEIDQRDVTPWETREAFETQLDINTSAGASATTATASATGSATPAPAGSGTGTAPPKVAYDVRSNFFQVRIDVEAEGIRLTQYSLLERSESGQTRVIYRSRDTL